MSKFDLSRRDFLKLAGTGALAFALSELRLDHALATSPIKQGRITWSGIPLYDAPSFKAKEIRVFGMDQVVDVTAEVEGDEGYGNPYNKIWYQVENGYSYSGGLQPVETNYQKPKFNIPEKGQLGEITVPFSDTKKEPYIYAERSYRIYYGSTHWVKRFVVTRDEKSIWYEIYDRVLRKSLYVPCYAVRLIPNEELSLLSPDVPDEQKSIIVDLTTQLVTAFEGEKLVFSQRCSSGAKGTETPKGEFRTYHKGPSIHMTNQGDAIEGIYDLPGVPWVAFFTGNGDGFHGTYWHNDYGRPRSHGCVNLPSEAAVFIYRWTKPNLSPDVDYVHLPGEGTRVQIV